MFDLATKLKKYVYEIENEMGADEFTEWIAYYSLQDKDYETKINQLIATDASDEQKDIALFNMLRTFTRKPSRAK